MKRDTILILILPLALGLIGVAFGAYSIVNPGERDLDADVSFTLVMKENRFNGTNPTFSAKSGQTVRIHVVNEDPVRHNLMIDGVYYDRGANLLDPGDTDDIIFIVPNNADFLTYSCGPHPVIMDGLINIQR
ncbi:MAG: hypothetical protein ACE5KG_06680 [Nitrososphaerales archaeon]